MGWGGCLAVSHAVAKAFLKYVVIWPEVLRVLIALEEPESAFKY